MGEMLMPTPEKPTVGLTVDDMMDQVNTDFFKERKVDVNYLNEQYDRLEKCGCRSCYGLYAQAVRAFNTKWRMPSEGVQVYVCPPKK